jgi:hypothetical protein
MTAGQTTNNAYTSLATVPAGTWNDVADGTVYNTPMSGTTAPGANDIKLGSISDARTQGPMFLDPSRRLEAWDASLGGPGTVAHALAQLQVAYNPSSPAYDSRYTTAALIAWVRAGFAPTDTALKGAAHDGTDIGAIPVHPTVTILPPPGPAPSLFHFGPSSAPVPAGYTLVPALTGYSAQSGYGWLSGSIEERDRGPLLGTTALTQSFDMTAAGTFSVVEADGTYDVSVTLGDAQYAHGPMGVSLQGIQVDAVSTGIDQFVTRTYRVTVSGGRLDLGLRNLGSSVDVVTIDDMSITPVPASAAAKQTITWASPADIVYGTPLSSTQLDAIVSATGSDPTTGALTYTPSAGTVLSAGAGQTLTVSVAATASYNAVSGSVTINVLKATPTIIWPTPADITYGTPLSATQLDATASFGGVSVPGHLTYATPLGSVLSAGAGQVLSVTFTPDDTTDFNPATAAATINVSKATPVLTWANPSALPYGTPLGASQLDASASFQGVALAGTFAYSPGMGAVLHAGGQVLSATFTPTDSSDFNPVTVTAMINVLQATPTII